VALEQMKRLEGEVLNFLDSLGDTQGRLDLAGVSVDPHQLLGIELNPRAAEVAEMVLWIGYLQWHYRTRGNVNPPLPVLKDFHNIECRDAVLAYDRVDYETDADGRPVTRWDGKTMKSHPVTGLPVPDERAQVPVEKYINPRAAQWPEADFVIGNPPFIGKGKLRESLGDGYVEALRGAWPAVPDSADLVMYWWERAAQLTRAGKLRRFGLITTNSIRQTFNRRVVEQNLTADPPISLRFAIPDHPWVDSTDGAAVRVSMTVGELAGTASEGIQHVVIEETEEINPGDDAIEVRLDSRVGLIHADLKAGANVSAAIRLCANGGVTSNGVMLGGRGFLLSRSEAASVESGAVKQICNGNDVLQAHRSSSVIDFHGLTIEQARTTFPAAFQIVLDRVKPERDQNRRASRRARYWIFSETMPQLRAMLAGTQSYLGTPETSKHRLFVRLASTTLPEHPLIAIAVGEARLYGVLCSRLHFAWSLATGGTLEDRPRYNKSRCFETYAFPPADSHDSARIGQLAQHIDAHRKRVQSQHPDLTLTGLYNVLETLRRGEPLTAKEKTIHDHGLVSVLRDLHDDLDRAVFAAYGWDDLAAALVGKPGATTPWPEKPAEQAAAEEELLSRLVALNAERAAEEARGLVRWLRPEFQAAATPAGQQPDAQTEIDVDTEVGAAGMPPTPGKPAALAGKRAPWPATLPEQIRLVADTVTQAARPLDLDQLADHFTGRGAWKKRLPDIVDSLAALGRLRIERAGASIVLHG